MSIYRNLFLFALYTIKYILSFLIKISLLILKI